MKLLRTFVAAALTAGLVTAAPPQSAPAHEAPDPVGEAWHVHERLLVSDSRTGDIVFVDDGRIRDRVSTPKAPISLARSADGTLAFALRGRAADRHHVSMIDTAYDSAHAEARLPYVARTWVTTSPGGVNHGRLPEASGKIGIPSESEGVLQWFDPKKVTGFEDPRAGTLDLGQPGHYSLVVSKAADGAELLHVGNIRGTSRVIDIASGKVVSTGTGSCPTLHGGILSPDGTRVIFSCANGLRVVPADPTGGGEQSFVPYPADRRVAVMFTGADGVVWGSTGGAPTTVQRIDTTPEVPTITEVALGRLGHKRTALRVDVSPDGKRLYVLTHQGYLQVRDGNTGRLIRERRVMKKVSTSLDETTEVAILPDLAFGEDSVHLSVPQSGTVLTLATDLRGRIRTLRVGGTPTRMVVLTH
ncbi:MAG: WD40 repeat domain-containing protein [Micropruina sp.]